MKGQNNININLPSSPPLPEPYVELIIQQLLIVCTHINCYRQALKKNIITILWK